MVFKTSGHSHTAVVGVGSSAFSVAAGVGSPVGHDDAFPCDDSFLVGVMFREGLYRGMVVSTRLSWEGRVVSKSGEEGVVVVVVAREE
jgi:hypothetical protein